MRKSRKKRLQNFIIILLLSSAGVLLVLFSLNSKLDLFYSPTEMLLAQPHQESRIKLGGMVKTGSINRVGTNLSSFVDIVIWIRCDNKNTLMDRKESYQA